ncbi:MAG: DNA polymerase I [Deltaproteobacteria bacterium]|nr:DNA polymerase I [Deltaproteobacteria bacterium]
MPTLTLIDGSGFVFRAYHALPPLSNTKGVPTHAVYGFTTMLLKALREHAPTHVAMVLDASRKSFRTDLDPTYKANRPETPPDLAPQFPLVREVTRALSVPILEEQGVEADDVIATLARRARALGWEVVIVTGDKDFTQLVGEGISLYDPMAEASGRGGWTGPAEVEKKMGVPPERVVEYQSLLGDKVDNVPGIPGVGEVTAAALVKHFGTVEAMLARADEIPQAVSRGGAKLAEKIRAGAERLRLNRKLVELRGDLDLPVGPEELARRPADDEAARRLFAELEFNRLLKDLPPPPPTARTEQVETLLDAAALRRAVEAARAAGQVGVEPLHEGTSPRTGALVGLGLGAGGRAWYLPLGHRYLGAPAQLGEADAARELRPLLEDASLPKHAHDQKALDHVAARLGLACRGAGLDTELASRLLQPARKEHALADVARDRLSCELPALTAEAPARGREAAGPGSLPVEQVAAVAGARAAVLCDLAATLSRALADEGLSRLHDEVERPLVAVLAGMERAGIAVDRGAMEALSTEFGKALRDLESRIHSAAGHAFNVASTRELGQVLFEELGLPVVKRLKTGPSTDVEVLEKLAEQHELPRLVLEHRSLAKLKGTYADTLPQLIEPDGRIHTTFQQLGAATGRLSSIDPNLQNIPVRTELSRRIRAAFTAPPGRVLVSADYSQVELRILAHYAEDPALLAAFEKREDVHAATAAETFGVAREAVTADQRRVAKVLNFGIAYGLSAFGLSQRLDLPAAEAKAIIDRYFARYAGVKRWLEATVAEAKKSGEVRTLWGRRRALPDIGSRNPGLRQAAERMAVNTPIQGTAADLAKRAMIRADAALRAEQPGARLLLQVHDELLVEADEGQAPAVGELLAREMSAAGTLRVPLEVEVGWGKSWADAH